VRVERRIYQMQGAERPKRRHLSLVRQVHVYDPRSELVPVGYRYRFRALLDSEVSGGIANRDC